MVNSGVVWWCGVCALRMPAGWPGGSSLEQPPATNKQPPLVARTDTPRLCTPLSSLCAHGEVTNAAAGLCAQVTSPRAVRVAVPGCSRAAGQCKGPWGWPWDKSVAKYSHSGPKIDPKHESQKSDAFLPTHPQMNTHNQQQRGDPWL